MIIVIMLITLLLVSVFLEFLVYVPLFWRVKRLLVMVNMTLLTGLLLLTVTLISTKSIYIILSIALVFRIINMLRIAVGRMHDKYLKQVTLKTSIWMLIFQALIVSISASHATDFSVNTLKALVIVQLSLIVALLIVTTLNIIRSRLKTYDNYFSDSELPTVTVAIPARNETPELERCLISLLSSDYPKLEIIVLDDCSQDSTPDILKSFAHDGVRFVKGSQPDDSWLPKNYAYQKLSEEASGDYLLFCGVDTKFETSTIRQLVTYISNHRLAMLSVLPLRFSGASMDSFIQPMRYWWELSLPRWALSRPPVLSTCWLIKKSALTSLGSLESVKRSILPERYFARELNRQSRYQFIRSNPQLGLQTIKPYSDQLQTAIRVRYPQVHRRPELVFLILITEIVGLLGPYFVLVFSIFTHLETKIVATSILCIVLLTINHLIIVGVSNPSNVPLAMFNLPFVICTELYLGLLSMIKYEFGRVEWKERNICIPVMHVYPHLPPPG